MTITPSRIRLSGKADTALERMVKIIPIKEYPFDIISVEPKTKKNITCELKTIKGDSGNEYELLIKNIQKNKGSYSDSITIKTSSQIKPEITLKVSGYIMPPAVPQN